MSEGACRMLHSEDRIVANPVAIRSEMQTIVRSAAEPWSPGDSVKAAVQRASRKIGLPYRRIRSFWYAQADAWAHEADRLRAWRVLAEHQQEQRLRDELHALQARLGRLRRAQD